MDLTTDYSGLHIQMGQQYNFFHIIFPLHPWPRVKKMLRIVSFVRFYVRIRETINCFPDLLTFDKFMFMTRPFVNF